MKIYVITYKEYFRGKKVDSVFVEKIEARETKKTYVLENRPYCTWRTVVKKSEIGEFQSETGDGFMFSLTPDTKLFREKMIEKTLKTLEQFKRRIEECQEIIENANSEKVVEIEDE